MKSLLLAGRTAVCSMFTLIITKSKAKLARMLNHRPALKRGLLVLLLFAVLAVPLAALFGVWAASLWALVLAAVFLGLGAERTSTDWDAMFALPAPRYFKFWQWHALERKRYFAVLAALAMGQLFVLILPALWGLV